MNLSLPLGVDILEWKKAAAFYRSHRRRLGELLQRSEVELLANSKNPSRTFAVLFAAKEAVFKALGSPWMGFSGFKEIQVLPDKGFAVRLKGRLKKFSRRKLRLKVSVGKNPRHVVAVCHPAAIRPCAGT